MVELHIKIRKRIARLAYGENFVSYNEGYKIIFDFDKEWDSIENKTARFIFGENYIDYPFNGNEVEIPLIKNADTLEIGVYSNNLYTTTPVKFKVLKSIKDEEKIEILVPEVYPEIEELDDEDLIKVYDKSEEKIGISPLKKLFDRMKVAIDEALTAAKASGEFDGADGKSAYSYAVDGGYTGTEAEFAAKLAAEGLDKALYVVNITMNSDGTLSADKTFAEITQVYNEGKYHIVLKLCDLAEGILPLASIDKLSIGFANVSGEIYHSCFIRSDNEILFRQKTLAFETTKLPNPYPLTFTGAVNETYDGSSAKTITIPNGGGGGEKEWRLMRTISIAEAVASVSISQDDNGNAFEVEDIFIYAPKDVITSANTQLIVMFNDNEGNSSSLNDFLGTTAKSLFYESYWSGMRVSRMGSMTYDFAGAAGNAAIVRLNAAPQKINKIDLTLQGSTTFTAGTFYIYAR